MVFTGQIPATQAVPDFPHRMRNLNRIMVGQGFNLDEAAAACRGLK